MVLKLLLPISTRLLKGLLRGFNYFLSIFTRQPVFPALSPGSLVLNFKTETGLWI